MAQLMEYAEYLSKEIGPRPAGTEEEQQAALYITEQFQKDAGFSAQIEEFTGSSNLDFIGAVPGIVVIVVAILGMVFPMLAIPTFVVAAVAAALYALEAFGHPIVTRSLARGASQNVVAKYQPNPDAASSGRGRSRKIVLVANYDSGKVTPKLVQAVESISLPIPIGLVCVGGIVLAAFFLLLHVFVNNGVGAIIINILTVLSLIVCLYPVLRAVLYRTAPYNEGANANASGTAALLEVARRISRGSVSEADLADDPDLQGIRIHGEAAARESGLVPEGAQILYESERLVPPEEIGMYDDEERLLSAKAAIAALTGQPVERRTYGSVAPKLVNSRAQDEAPAEGAPDEDASGQMPQELADGRREAATESSTPLPEPIPAPKTLSVPPMYAGEPAEEQAEAEGFKNAPSWFVSAQQNAKKPTGETGPIQRSRYAEAIEAAEREAAARERERAEQERFQREAELKAREEAARAAIASAGSDRAPETEPVEPSPSAAEPAEELGEPPALQFVPYAEAHPEATLAGHKPAEDEFAASLGSTVAFSPLMVEEAAVPATNAEPRPAQRRLEGLPSIGLDEPVRESAATPSAGENGNPSRSGMFRRLRTDVPSMSGVIRMQEAGLDVSQQPGDQPATPRDRAGASEVAADQTPAPVTEALPAFDQVAQADRDRAAGEARRPEDVAQAREADLRGTEGDEADRVDVPKTRSGGFFSRFRRNKRERLEETPQEWLDVDEDFDARTVGRERGGWESFRDDAPDERDERYDERRPWEGGSYSRVRLGHVDTRSGVDAEADVPIEAFDDADDQQIAEEIEQIYHFRNPLYNTEIWFVALGSEMSRHDGVKAFLAEHADDLRGAMVIEVESLGAGELCVASEEGRISPVIASSRVKRYTRAATAATGIAPGSVSLAGYDSASSIIQSAGYQAMHLLGVENGRPALKGSPDDILENIDDLLLDDNVNFLMELLKK